jgi:uncharacterized membrane protein
MSLPSSEPLPNDIHDLPPARQRHIRRQPRSASLAERQILLVSLLKLTAPTTNFFLLSLIGALVMGASLVFDEPAILIVAIVILPFLRPVFALALYPTSLKFSYGLKSLVSLLILSALTFGAGTLAGWVRLSANFTGLSIFRFSALYWLDLTILSITVLLSSLILLRKGQLPRLACVILSYMLLVPTALSGFGLTIGQPQLWPGALFVALIHLGLSILLAMLTFLIFGFSPKKLMGWLIVIVTLTLTLAGLTLSLTLTTQQIAPVIQPSPSTTPSLKAIYSATLEASTPTITFTPTQTPSQTATTTRTPSQTPTTEPTSYWAVIDITMGAVIRETGDFEAPVVGYANDGDLIEIIGEALSGGSSRWYQVRTATGETGWILSSLVNTQTPTP